MSTFPFSLSSPLDLSGYGDNISFVFHPGMLFDSERKWWSPQGQRLSPHEGLDLCLLQLPGQAPEPLPADTPVLAAAPGRVVAMTPDFLGQSVIISHGQDQTGSKEWISLLAHIDTHPDIDEGLPLESGQEIGRTKTFTYPRGMLCHLHLSIGLLLTPRNYDLAWPELTQRIRVHFIDPLPLLPIASLVWDDAQEWFAFLEGLIQQHQGTS
jgi:murein DD-endopeptidase MepM/ murein hydrolase activator NlpD